MRYFIADCHFGHEKLIRAMLRCYPGTKTLFESVEAHDTHLIDAINLVVEPKDELFVLGDFCLAKPGRYRSRIKCKRVRLIRGNHDPCLASKNVFGEIPYVAYTKVRDGDGESMRMVLCHTPMAYWDGSHQGWGHLYGHCHGQRELTLDWAFGHQRRSMDVGVEHLFRWQGDYFPLPEADVYNMFIVRPGHDPPSYYNQLHSDRDKLFFQDEEKP